MKSFPVLNVSYLQKLIYSASHAKTIQHQLFQSENLKFPIKSLKMAKKCGWMFEPTRNIVVLSAY